MSCALTKQLIRSKILLELKLQKEEYSKQKSRFIKNKLFRQRVFQQARTVMFYIALDGEVNTWEMISAARKMGKRIAVPVCRGENLMIRPCLFEERAHLRKGPYGIREPAGRSFIKSEDIDLVVVPGVAFDKQGNRLGRGKGCYDRFLRKLSATTSSVGLAFDFQILPQVPASALDVRVQRVVFA